MENYLAVSCRIRVRYNDHGNTGYAFNGNYLVWMQQAADDLFDAAGLQHLRFPLTAQSFSAVNVDSNFKNPIKMDDEIEIKAFVKEIDFSNIRIQYDFKKNKDLLAVGHTEHAYVDPNSEKVIPIPEEIKGRLISSPPF